MRKLEDKNAIVTGGARGVGRAITERFIKDGAKVLICSRSIEELKKTSKEIDPSGKSLSFLEADVSNYKECQKLFAYAKKIFKTLDILVNNAGIYGPIGLSETNPPKDWLKTIEINIMGTGQCT